MASRYLFLLFASVVFSSPIDPPAIETINFATRVDSPYRLPEGAVEVIHYQIQLRVTEETFTTAPNSFEGSTSIIFQNLLNTNEIKLHANEINISSVVVVTRSGNEIQIIDQSLNTTTEILTLTTEIELIGTEFYQLEFEYVGRLRADGLNGFYRSSYVNATGHTRYLGTTQMQPTSARKAFPSFDEPSYKAEFDISIRHPREYTAVGNTAGTRYNIADEPDFVITSFGTTPRMPTYLIAFIVSDFTCTQANTTIGPGLGNNAAAIAHYICSREEESANRALANEYGVKITWAMEEFTGVKFVESRIGKIHQFAIPDFSAGAMENWGLITYREQYLLWDPLESSNRNKHNVITIVAHELAHFWFGNYVTCHWWSDTFLNEGFATYFEYMISQVVDPTLETDKQFVLLELQPMLVTDSSPNSAPLSSPASSQGEISNRFSSVSYNKGGSVFRMVEHVMGLANFKLGLNAYLTTNRFGNTRPENLWESMQLFVPNNALPIGQTLASVMDNWVNRGGFPLLNVTGQGNSVTVTQSRFLSTEDQPSPDDQWFVPISYTTSATLNKFQDTSVNAWLTPGGSVTIPLATESDWIILNNQQIGYYRVDYDANLWSKIRTALNRPGFDGIHEINRAQLVDDFYNFARYGRKSFAELLELYTFLRADTSYYSWYSALTAFSAMIQRTSDEVLVRILNAYISELLTVVYNSVPFNQAKDDDQMYTLTKTLIMPWACRLNFQDCVDSTLSAFARYRNSGERLDKNLKATILCNGLRHSTDRSDWDFLYNEYINATLATDQSTILTALGCSRDETILRDYLSRSITPNSGIRQQDASSVFSAVYSGNPEGVDIAFDFLLNNYQAIANSYGSMNALNNLFSGLASRFTTTNQTEALTTFISENDLGSAEGAAIASLNSAINNLQWTEKFEAELRVYFELGVPEDTTPSGTPASGSSLVVGLTTFITTLLILCYQFSQ